MCSHDQAVPGLKSPHSPPPHPRLCHPWAPVSWLTQPEAFSFVLFSPQFLECSSFLSCLACVHVPVSLPSDHPLPGTPLYSHRPNRLIASMANPSPPPQGLQIQCRGLLEFSIFISLACLLVFPGASPLPAPRQGSLSSRSLPLPQCPERCPARGQDLPPPELGSPQSRRPGRPLPTGYTAETPGLICCPQEGGSLGPPRFLGSGVWRGRPPPGDAPGREGRLSSRWEGGEEWGPLRGGEGLAGDLFASELDLRGK